MRSTNDSRRSYHSSSFTFTKVNIFAHLLVILGAKPVLLIPPPTSIALSIASLAPALIDNLLRQLMQTYMENRQLQILFQALT